MGPEGGRNAERDNDDTFGWQAKEGNHLIANGIRAGDHCAGPPQGRRYMCLEESNPFGRMAFRLMEYRQIMHRHSAALRRFRQEKIGAVEKVRTHHRQIAQMTRPIWDGNTQTPRFPARERRGVPVPSAVPPEPDRTDGVVVGKPLCQLPRITANAAHVRRKGLNRESESHISARSRSVIARNMTDRRWLPNESKKRGVRVPRGARRDCPSVGHVGYEGPRSCRVD
jgi:hypothetical protein